ncbi:MAG: class I SAM-dependent methyltransferase [Pseudomonadota bacterium]|nr:class I SAM-dependent methyltransferase [Pseudomonadota bacterium]
MNSLYRMITNCRGCGHSSLKPVWDLGDQYLADCLAPGETGRQAPLQVVRCEGCGLAQLLHSVSRDALYAKYYYKSGTNETMRAALKDVAEEAFRHINEVGVGVVLDIGSNDGFLLSQFPKDWIKLGVDPSDIQAECLKGNSGVYPSTVHTIRGYFPEATKTRKRGSFDVITSVAVFYDSEDPLDFMKEVARLLRPNGVWVNQLNTLPACMERNAFDFISHEHLCYYTVCDLASLARRAGLDCIDGQILELNGGTARLVFKKKSAKAKPTARLVQLNLEEIKGGYTGELTGPESWAKLKARVNANGVKLRELIKSFDTVYVRGASTRGNSLLQYYGLGVKDLPFAADRDPAKWGKRMAGTDIPIISEQEAKARNPDAFLLLPYSYLDSFLARDKEWLLTGGKFIIPLPEARVVP